MLKRVGLGIATVFTLLAIVIAFLVVSAIFFGHSSLGGTLPGGRSVSASANHWFMGMETNGDIATIRTAGRTIVVAPTALSVDGAPAASIPAETKSVTIRVENGEVDFVADGRRVGQDPKSKLETGNP